MVCRTVHFIRHEKTQANKECRYIGHTNQEILAFVKADIALTPKLVYGSDLLRCQQTAQCYFPQAKFVGDARLRELDFGAFEMKTYADLEHDPRYRAWIDDPYTNSPPNGESMQRFKQRVMDAFYELASDGAVFIVHGGVIQMILSTLCSQDFYAVQAKHRMVYTMEWEGQVCKSLSEVPITVREAL